jgi:signal transduction histidine kinase
LSTASLRKSACQPKVLEALVANGIWTKLSLTEEFSMGQISRQTNVLDHGQVEAVALQQIRVMLIADNPLDVVFLRGALTALRTSTFVITAVKSLSDLRGRSSQGRFDVVITDLGLPDSTGLKTFRQVKEWAAGIPIIVLTAHDNEQLGLNAVREGAHDYLVKGEITGKGLSRAIRYVVDRSRIEEQLRQAQRLEAVGVLAGGIAHDFNNLLHIVEGHLSLLLGQSLGAQETSDSLLAIREATKKQAALTRQLLTFGRQQIMEVKPLDLTALMQSLRSALLLILGKTVRLDLRMADLELWIDGDKGLLEQVMFELAANARDAMPKGGTWTISSAVSLISHPEQCGSPATPHATFTLEDTGRGIPPAILNRIYEPFFTTKDVGEGSGLGLATVHSVVDQHGGWLEVSSEVGVGTSFRLRLPLRATPILDRRPQEVPLIPPAAPSESIETCRPTGSATILLVEDEVALRNLAKKVLERYDFVVLAAASGPEACQIWETHGEEVDLLFTDLNLPGGHTGHQLARDFLSHRPELRVLYTSGYSADYTDQSTPFREGHNFLQKPYAVKTMAQAVEQMLSSKPATDG